MSGRSVVLLPRHFANAFSYTDGQISPLSLERPNW
jgi:hypothetical protein